MRVTTIAILVVLSLAWLINSPLGAQPTLNKDGELEIKPNSRCTVYHGGQKTTGAYLGEHKDRVVIAGQEVRVFIPIREITSIEVPR